MTALGTGILVAVVAGAFAVGGAALTARREHERWLRQARYEAYSDFLAAAEAVIKPLPDTDGVGLIHAFLRAGGRVHLLGPPSIDKDASEVTRFVEKVWRDSAEYDGDEHISARTSFILAARRQLSDSPRG